MSKQTEYCRTRSASECWQSTPPESVRTEKMYMPARRRPDQMTVDQLRRGLCAKSGGNWRVCETYPGSCGIGAQMVRYMTGKAEPPAEELPKANAPRIEQLPVETSNRGKYSSSKRMEIAIAARKAMLAGKSMVAIGKEYGYSGSGIKRLMIAAGVEVPKIDTANIERHEKAMQRYLKTMAAIMGGMDRNKAAREIGGYCSYDKVRTFGNLYKDEIAARMAQNTVSQAVAD